MCLRHEGLENRHGHYRIPTVSGFQGRGRPSYQYSSRLAAVSYVNTHHPRFQVMARPSYVREEASSMVTAGATANTTKKKSHASRESGGLASGLTRYIYIYIYKYIYIIYIYAYMCIYISRYLDIYIA